MGKKRGGGQTQPWQAGGQHQLMAGAHQVGALQNLSPEDAARSQGLGQQLLGGHAMPPQQPDPMMGKSMVQVNPGLQPQMGQPQMSPFQMRRQGYAQAGQHPMMARLFQNYWGR